jgi:hypothetical protein
MGVMLAATVNVAVYAATVKHKSGPHLPTHQYIAGEAWRYLDNLQMNGDPVVTKDLVDEFKTYIGNKTDTYIHPHNNEQVITYTGWHVGMNPPANWEPGDNGAPDVPWSEYDESEFLGASVSGSCQTTINTLIGSLSRVDDLFTAGSCVDPGNDIIEGIHEEDVFQLANLESPIGDL